MVVGGYAGQLQAEHAEERVRAALTGAATDGAQDCGLRTCLLNGSPVQMADALQNPHLPTYRTTNVHLDILMGRDESIEPADYMVPGAHSISNAALYLLTTRHR